MTEALVSTVNTWQSPTLNDIYRQHSVNEVYTTPIPQGKIIWDFTPVYVTEQIHGTQTYAPV